MQKSPPFALTAQRDDNNQQCDVHGLETTQRPGIAQAGVEGVFDGVHRRGDQDAELIGQSWQQAASLIRRQFVQVRGNHSPGPLYPGLHDDGCDCNRRQRAAECPSRNGRKR